MSVIHEERTTAFDLRLMVLPAIIGIGLVTLFLRLWYLQIVQSEALREEAAKSRTMSVTRIAPRGLIEDRTGFLLATVKPEMVVTAVPKTVLAEEETLARVVKILGKDLDEVTKLLKNERRKYVPMPIAQNVTISQATKIAEMGADALGFNVETFPMRSYNEPVDFAHVIGYIQPPSEKDVERLEKEKLTPAPFVGKSGVERAYEAQLMGVPGAEKFEVDAKRRPIRSVGTDSSVPGARLKLSIDARLQKLALEKLGPYTGAVVAIDPKTGEVLCLASKPAYDASQWLGGISSANFRALQNDPLKPLFHRALRTAYSPGSTFKAVTALASQIAGKFDPNRYAFCPGFYKVGNRKIKCLGTHGSISFNRAFEKSCNTYFIDMGMRAGKESMRKACELMGLGSKLDLDIGGEGLGQILDEELIRRKRFADQKDLFKRGRIPVSEVPEKWEDARDYMYGGELANFAIGQGEMAATTLQMAQVTAFIANRGKSYKPHVVRSYKTAGVNGKVVPIQPELSHEYKATPQFWAALTGAMLSVVESGTARSGKIPGVLMGGKTGSAEVRGKRLTNSWFIAFAPIDNPKIAIAVLAENAGHGSEVAVPIASPLVAAYLSGKYPSNVTPKNQPIKPGEKPQTGISVSVTEKKSPPVQPKPGSQPRPQGQVPQQKPASRR